MATLGWTTPWEMQAEILNSTFLFLGLYLGLPVSSAPLTKPGQDERPHEHDGRLQGVRVNHSRQAP